MEGRTLQEEKVKTSICSRCKIVMENRCQHHLLITDAGSRRRSRTMYYLNKKLEGGSAAG